MSRIPWVEIEANSDRDFKIYGKDILNLFNQWGRVNDELKFLKNKFREYKKVVAGIEKQYELSIKENEMIRMELIETKQKLIGLIKENKEISIVNESLGDIKKNFDVDSNKLHYPEKNSSKVSYIEDIKELDEIESDNLNFKYICPNCDYTLPENFVNSLRRGFNQDCPQCHFMISFKALIPIMQQ